MKMDKQEAFEAAEEASKSTQDNVVAPKLGRHAASMGRYGLRLDWRRHMRLILLGVVPLAVVAGAAGFWLMGGRYVSTDNAYVKADIIQVASDVAGRVLEVRIKDHSHVAKGDVLIRLDPEPFKLALAKADAELDGARSQVDGAKMSLEEAKAELKEATSRQEYLQAQATRQRELAGRGVSPITKLEQADSDALQASDRVMIARKKIARILAILGNPNSPTDSFSSVREKTALRDRAALDLQYTEIKAAADGTAVNVKLQIGEQIRPATPLFAVVADRRPWVEANFKETDLTNVRPGQKATVVLDIYPDITWEAEIESISPATGAEFAILPPQNASGNWVKVVQRLPVRVRINTQSGEPPLRAGMTASVTIDTERKRSLAHLLGLSSSANASSHSATPKK